MPARKAVTSEAVRALSRGRSLSGTAAARNRRAGVQVSAARLARQPALVRQECPEPVEQVPCARRRPWDRRRADGAELAQVAEHPGHDCPVTWLEYPPARRAAANSVIVSSLMSSVVMPCSASRRSSGARQPRACAWSRPGYSPAGPVPRRPRPRTAPAARTTALATYCAYLPAFRDWSSSGSPHGRSAHRAVTAETIPPCLARSQALCAA